MTDMCINEHSIKLSKLDKLFWSNPLYTKGDLIQYYIEVAPYLLPLLQDRPLSLTRYPDGINGKWFYQKNKPAHAPRWIPSFLWRSGKGKVTNYILCNNLETLVWLANQACIEIHPWFSRYDAVDYPDVAVFDLDPMDPLTFDDAREVAILIKGVLDELNIRAVPKTSGATGIHIYVPILRKFTYKEVQLFIQYIGRVILQAYPHKISIYERWVKDRQGKVYIDYLQNNRGQTVASAYSVRPQEGAPVSMPFRWEDIYTVQPSMYTMKTAKSRLQEIGAFYRDVLREKQDIRPFLRKAMD
jgi:bifunctional non-homologous end joining protein LigD